MQARKMQEGWQQAHRYERDRVADDLAGRPFAVGFDDGEHADAGAGVILAAHCGDRMEVGELPEEHYPEERRRLDSDLVAGRSPSEQRGQSAGKSADERTPMRARFERRVEEQVARQRGESPERRERIEKPREVGFGYHRNRDAESERAARGDFPGG